MTMANEHKFFASTEGSYIEQDLIRMWPTFTVTSVNKETGKFETLYDACAGLKTMPTPPPMQAAYVRHDGNADAGMQ